MHIHIVLKSGKEMFGFEILQEEKTTLRLILIGPMSPYNIWTWCKKPKDHFMLFWGTHKVFNFKLKKGHKSSFRFCNDTGLPCKYFQYIQPSDHV